MKLKTWDFLKKELEDFAKENEDNFSRQQIVSHINPPKKSSGSYARMTNNTPPEPRKFMVAQKSTMEKAMEVLSAQLKNCLLYTSPSPRDKRQSRMPSSA